MESVLPQWLQDVETTLSLIGFVLTYVVFQAVREVRLSFQRRTRLPEIRRDLVKFASSLSTALAASDKESVKIEVRAATAILKTARRLLPKDDKSEVTAILRRIDIAKRKNHARLAASNGGWDFYSDILLSIRVLEQAIKNVRWA